MRLFGTALGLLLACSVAASAAVIADLRVGWTRVRAEPLPAAREPFPVFAATATENRSVERDGRYLNLALIGSAYMATPSGAIGVGAAGSGFGFWDAYYSASVSDLISFDPGGGSYLASIDVDIRVRSSFVVWPGGSSSNAGSAQFSFWGSGGFIDAGSRGSMWNSNADAFAYSRAGQGCEPLGAPASLFRCTGVAGGILSFQLILTGGSSVNNGTSSVVSSYSIGNLKVYAPASTSSSLGVTDAGLVDVTDQISLTSSSGWDYRRPLYYLTPEPGTFVQLACGLLGLSLLLYRR